MTDIKLQLPGEIRKDWSFLEASEAAFNLNWVGQLVNRAELFSGVPDDPNYRVQDEPTFSQIADEHLSSFTNVRNHDAYESTRLLIERNQRYRQIDSEAGGFWSRFAGNSIDPVNLIPLPLAAGKGFMGGIRAVAPTAFSTIGLSEAVRHSLDPTSTVSETIANTIVGTAFVSGIGGLVGKAFAREPSSLVHDAADSAGHGALRRYWNKFTQSASESNTPPLNGGKATQSTVDNLTHGRVTEERYRSEVASEYEAAGHKPPSYEAFNSGRTDDLLGSAIRFVLPSLDGATRGARVMVARIAGAADIERIARATGQTVDAVRASVGDAEAVVLKNEGRDILRGWGIESAGTLSEGIARASEAGGVRVGSYLSRTAHDISKVRIEDLIPEAAGKTAQELALFLRQYSDGLVRDADGVPIHRTATPTHTLMTRVASLEHRLTREKAEFDRIARERQDSVDELARARANNAPEQSIQEIEKRIDSADALLGQRDHVIAETRARIAETGQNGNLYDIETPTNLERLYGATAQWPFFRLVKNNLDKVAPELAQVWSRLAWQIAGSPNLRSTGGAAGYSAGTSVEVMSKIYQSLHTDWRKGHENIWRNARGKNPNAGTFTSAFSRIFDREKNPNPTTAAEMTFEQFNRAVWDEYHVPGTFNDEHIKNAAQHAGRLIRKVGNQVEVLGIFNGQRRIKNALENAETKLTNLREKKSRSTGQAAEDLGVKIGYIEKTIGELKEEYAKISVSEPGKNADLMRVWRRDLIEQNPEAFRAKLRELFSRGEPFWLNGRRIQPSTSADQIEIRVDEAFNTIMRGSEDFDSAAMRQQAFEDSYQRQIDYHQDRAGRLREYGVEKLNSEQLAELNAHERMAAGLEKNLAKHRKYGQKDFNEGVGTRGLYKNRLTQIEKELETAGPSRSVELSNERDHINWWLEHGNTIAAHGSLHSRIPVDNAEVAGFIERDITSVMQLYMNKIAPQVEMASRFGDTRMSHHMDNIVESSLEYADQVSKTDPERAAKIVKEIEALRGSAQDLRDIVLGFGSLPEDMTALDARAIRLLMSYNVLTTMGRVIFSTFNDAGNLIGASITRGIYGGKMFEMLMAQAGENARGYGILANEAHAANVMSEIINATASSRFYDVNLNTPSGGGVLGKVERLIFNETGRMFFLNLLAPWTDGIKKISAGVASHSLMQDSIAWKNGTLSAARKADLTKLGITEDIAIRFAQQWELSGKNMVDNVYLPNTARWSDVTAARRFSAAVHAEVNNVVITPGAADKPKVLLSNGYAKIVGQYHGFAMAATNRLLMAGLQSRDARAATAVVSMITISMMMDIIKTPDFSNVSIEERLFRAVERSGVLGIFSDLNQVVENATGGELGVRAAIGLDPMNKNPTWASRMGALGAVPGQYAGLLYAFGDSDADTIDRAYAIKRMIIYNNLVWWNGIANSLTRSSAELYDDAAR